MTVSELCEAFHLKRRSDHEAPAAVLSHPDAWSEVVMSAGPEYYAHFQPSNPMASIRTFMGRPIIENTDFVGVKWVSAAGLEAYEAEQAIRKTQQILDEAELRRRRDLFVTNLSSAPRA